MLSECFWYYWLILALLDKGPLNGLFLLLFSWPVNFWICKSFLLPDAHTQPFYSSLDFVWDNPGGPVPKEAFTHLHLSWSSIILYMLSPSYMVDSILPVQFTCLTVFISVQVFFGLPLGLSPCTSYSIHFFTKSLFSFHCTQHMPIPS